MAAMSGGNNWLRWPAIGLAGLTLLQLALGAGALVHEIPVLVTMLPFMDHWPKS